jgi:hypothetical protein
MAFLRYANAQVVHPRFQAGSWDSIRTAARQPRLARSLVDQASEILGAEFDPKRYLLTHATIVASVDTEEVPGVKLGSVTENGKKVVRKTSSFYVTVPSTPYVNNNMDCWSREVLRKSYATFKGAHSFVEHVQVEELSKGRILDAVLRDIGPSLYVDILIANDRKHTELIRDIETGELKTLSMGCSIDGTSCTKCGNWAADETEMCACVRYEKGNTFLDKKGTKRITAELCGDASIDPTGGVQFIEASWVKVPAFKGAVARNVVAISSASPETEKKVAAALREIFSAPAPAIPAEGYLKAARLLLAEGLDLSGEGETPPPEEGETPPPEEGASSEPSVFKSLTAPKSPFEELEKEIRGQILDNVRKKLKEEMSSGSLQSTLGPSSEPNDTLFKEGVARQRRAQALAGNVSNSAFRTVSREARCRQRTASAYRKDLQHCVRNARCAAELMRAVERLNVDFGISIPRSLYRVALTVGSLDRFSTLAAYTGACERKLGRVLTASEGRTLIRLGTLLSALRNRRRQAE